jgi:hypothetical protein
VFMMADAGHSCRGSSPSPSMSPSEFTTDFFMEHPNSIPLELRIVDQDAAKELQCGICLQLLNNPRQCKNGHLFCMDCISQSLEKNRECPQCRCPLRIEELARSLFVERHLRILKVYCRHHFAYNEDGGWYPAVYGCNETLSQETAHNHESTCGYALVLCKYSSACGKLRKAHLDEHEKSCPYRPETCSHCNADIQYNNMEEHIKVCGMVPVQCQRCSETIPRSELERHMKDICLEEEIFCNFHDHGCPKKMLRKDLKEHLQDDLLGHMTLMKKGFDDQIIQLRDDFETQLRLKDERIRHLEKVVRENGMYADTRIEWKVKNYSQLRKKSYLQSDKFTIAGFTWFIGFYTDGDNAESRGFISIYLFLDVGHMPKGKSITLEYNLKFINHADPNETIKKEFKTTFPIKGGQGWGDRKAIKSTLLETNGFLKDDTLNVEAEIAVKRVTWSV